MKPDAPELLERELSAARYTPRTIAIGTNTDPYQPIERRYEIMRRILEVLERAGHPVGIVTKSNLITRDIDILSRMAARNLAKVAVSVTTLDPKLARIMEPRAPTPPRRLEALRQLAAAGIRPRSWSRPSCPPSMMRKSSVSWMPPKRPASKAPATCCCGCRSRCATCSRNG